MSKFLALWASLPHVVQAAIVTFLSASGAYLGEALSNPSTLSFSAAGLHHYAAGAIAAGVLALRAFYMKPNLPTAAPKA